MLRLTVRLRYEDRVIEYSRSEEFEDELTGILSGQDSYALVLWGEGAWREYGEVRRILERRGFNPFSLDAVDSLEARLSGIPLERIVEARLSRLSLGSLGYTPRRVDPDKPVDRRSLLRRLALALTRYYPYPVVIEGPCSKLPSCNICVNVCPTGALEGKPPRLDVEKCTGCMLCVTSCPVDALTPPYSTRNSFRAYLKKAVNALGDSRGALLFVEWSNIRDLYELEERSLDGRLLVLPLHRLEDAPPRWAIDAVDHGLGVLVYSPRGLPPHFRDSEKMLSPLGAFAHVRSVDEIPEALPLVRAPSGSIIGELKKLEEPIELESPIVGVVEVDGDKCDLCGSCVFRCPTGALRLSEDTESKLTFRHEYCIACGECERVCPQDALVVKKILDPGLIGSEVTLAVDEMARCRSCGKPIGPRRHILEVERRLRSAGLPEAAVESVWYCDVCKTRRLFGQITPQS